MDRADVIIVGGGLAGLVTASEAVKRGRKVVILDQEGPQSLGGQAFWSLGGLFMINTPEQRRMGIRDSRDLAGSDWMGTAGFDRPEDETAKAFAETYLDFAAGEMRPWLHGLGMRWFPAVGWAERGGGPADGHGNSVPRFHLTWGTGPGVLDPFLKLAREAEAAGALTIAYRHRVSDLILEAGRVKGVEGEVLAEAGEERGVSTSRDVVGTFSMTAEAVVLASGGMGGDHDQVRRHWPVDRLGPAPKEMITGVPEFVDGKMLERAGAQGARLVNTDRMWHYPEGLRNYAPIWPKHGIRVLPGPSSMWFDALGQRLEAPNFPGFDALGTLKRILETGHSHSWFVLNQKIIEKEFALSGSEQNPDITSGTWRQVLKTRAGKGAPKPVEAFKRKGEDFVVAKDWKALVEGMNRLTPEAPLDGDAVLKQIEARDRQVGNRFCKDAQVIALRGARKYRGDRLIRTAKPHEILDPAHGPLIAVRLNVLTRKSLGGLQTDLEGRVFGQTGEILEGLFAVGEAAGFGGGGVHGYSALEGTFLGSCIFSGRQAGRAV